MLEHMLDEHMLGVQERCLCFEGGFFTLLFTHFLLQITTEKLLPFSTFTKCFCKNSFASLPIYKEAIYQITEVRKKKQIM